MTAALSPRDRKFFEDRNLGHLATLRADGSPNSTIVWLDVEDDHILVNTAEHRYKTKHVRRDPRVAISVADADDPVVEISVSGRVVEILPDPDWRHADKVSRKYDGQDFERRPGEHRVILKIEPDRVYRYNY